MVQLHGNDSMDSDVNLYGEYQITQADSDASWCDLPKKPCTIMSIDAVCNFLTVNGLSMYADVFRKNSVDGKVLIGLDEKQCGDLGVKSLHVKKLLRRIEDLKADSDKNSSKPTLEELKKMVLREKELRLSTEWQNRFAAAELCSDTDWLECVVDLQSQVVQEFSFPEETVHLLRTAHLAYPSEAFFRETPVQVKYNRARNGPLKQGADVSLVHICQMNGQKVPLWDFGGDERPLVIIGGSHS